MTVLQALRFHGQKLDDLRNIPESRWPALLDFTDQAHLTLSVGGRCRSALPEAVRTRIDQNLESNAKRYAVLRAAQVEIADCLRSRGVEFLVLKGLSQSPWYNDDPRYRPQYDIDLYCPEGAIAEALQAMRILGYEPAGTGDTRTDHLPVMIRKTGWKWRGDYYDPEMPPSVELHFRFWDPETEGFDIPGIDQFWRRRVVREVDGLLLPTLRPVDGATYSTMHLLRHLLRGDLRLGHVYELAHFLERSAAENDFWSEWRDPGLSMWGGPPGPQPTPSSAYRICWAGPGGPARTKGSAPLAGIAFRLASDWFGCDLNPVARRTVEELPASVKRWFDLFAFSSTSNRPNKNELWLHLCLVDSARERRRIAVRRLFPTSRSRVVAEAHVPASRGGVGLRLRRLAFTAWFLTRRVWFHANTLMPTMWSGWKWWRT